MHRFCTKSRNSGSGAHESICKSHWPWWSTFLSSEFGGLIRHLIHDRIILITFEHYHFAFQQISTTMSFWLIDFRRGSLTVVYPIRQGWTCIRSPSVALLNCKYYSEYRKLTVMVLVKYKYYYEACFQLGLVIYYQSCVTVRCRLFCFGNRQVMRRF